MLATVVLIKSNNLADFDLRHENKLTNKIRMQCKTGQSSGQMFKTREIGCWKLIFVMLYVALWTLVLLYNGLCYLIKHVLFNISLVHALQSTYIHSFFLERKGVWLQSPLTWENARTHIFIFFYQIPKLHLVDTSSLTKKIVLSQSIIWFRSNGRLTTQAFLVHFPEINPIKDRKV